MNATTEKNTKSHLLAGTLEMVPFGVNMNAHGLGALNI